MVPAAVPGFPVGGGEQRVGFLRGEVADDGALAAPGRDGQDLADGGGVLGCPRGRVAEQGVDRGQSGVAGGTAVSPVVFQVLQELPDQGGVEVGEAELARRFPGSLVREGQEQLAGVAVGRDRIRAGLFCRASRSVKNPCRMGARSLMVPPVFPAPGGRLPGRAVRGRPGDTSRSTSGRRGRARWTEAGAGPAHSRLGDTRPAGSRR